MRLSERDGIGETYGDSGEGWGKSWVYWLRVTARFFGLMDKPALVRDVTSFAGRGIEGKGAVEKSRSVGEAINKDFRYSSLRSAPSRHPKESHPPEKVVEIILRFQIAFIGTASIRHLRLTGR